MAPIRPFVPALVAALALSGCLGDQTITVDGPDGTAGEQPLEVYEYRWPGDARAPAGQSVGWAMRMLNPSDLVIDVAVETDADRHGPTSITGWTQHDGADGPSHFTMTPGRSVLWLFEATATAGGREIETVLSYERGGVEIGRTVLARNLGAAAGADVDPGMHVQTATVGLWVNGTSFYTNIAALNADPAFPAGYDRSGFGGDTLTIYVYDQDSSEQPPRSRDTCHGTTIQGYNALLKTQQEGSTGVRWLAPEEAYTTPGNEGFFLYGHPLVFVNTLVAIDGTTGPEDEIPDPMAECFDPEGYVPPVPPVTAA